MEARRGAGEEHEAGDETHDELGALLGAEELAHLRCIYAYDA